MSATETDTNTEKRAWLKELESQRLALKRQLFSADAQSASMSAAGGAKSYTNRSIADIKAKIAAIESEIAAVCEELGEPLPFATRGGVKTITVRFC